MSDESDDVDTYPDELKMALARKERGAGTFTWQISIVEDATGADILIPSVFDTQDEAWGVAEKLARLIGDITNQDLFIMKYQVSTNNGDVTFFLIPS
jgi:hypothetical protein